MAIEGLCPVELVCEPGSFWVSMGRSLPSHHAFVSEFALKPNVPDDVRQHYENAKNAWLYAYFAYRLLSVSLLTLHVAGEAALRASASIDGVPRSDSVRLKKLMPRQRAAVLLDSGESHWVADFANRHHLDYRPLANQHFADWIGQAVAGYYHSSPRWGQATSATATSSLATKKMKAMESGME